MGGTSHTDFIFKQHLCTSALEMRQSLWKCPGVSRRHKLKLMFKVATSSFSWSVGAWTVTQRKLQSLSATFSKPAKAAMRAPRFFHEFDEQYHRRLNRALKAVLQSCELPDVHVYVLPRMYNYVGHALRAFNRPSGHSPEAFISYRDSVWKMLMTVIKH